MSLSKEWDSVTPSTSGSPVVMPATVSDPDTSTDLSRFAEAYVKSADETVDNLFIKLDDLKKQMDVTMIELDLALAGQVVAHNNMPHLPELSAVTLSNAINLDLELELDVSPQPPANLQTVTNFADWSSTPVSVVASTAVLAAASTRRPTLLVPRVPRPVPGLLPVRPAKRSSKRPSSLKPSK